MIQPHIAPAYQLSPRSRPRLFQLSWDNSKIRTRNPHDERKLDKHMAWGTLYPNGLVTLDNGGTFETRTELEYQMELRGKYRIEFLDE
ncbi:MAG TPA: hypothetical protein VFA10_17870 [Ktedonobacteraceae bacterium]|nr:hypothetical protein [Ktedonobacteraceae bacterium]